MLLIVTRYPITIFFNNLIFYKYRLPSIIINNLDGLLLVSCLVKLDNYIRFNTLDRKRSCVCPQIQVNVIKFNLLDGLFVICLLAIDNLLSYYILYE